MMAIQRALFLTLVLAASVYLAEARTWTSTDGRSLEASFLDATDTEVILVRDEDAKEFTIPLSRLSEEDQVFIAKEVAKKKGLVRALATGLFEDKVTGEWEKLEFEGMKFRFYAAPDLGGGTYPVLVYLHGKGQGGDDNEKQLSGQVKKFASGEIYGKHPCFLMVPQCPDDEVGWKEDNLYKAIDIVVEMQANLPVDKDRIYITGVSMGGFGAWKAVAEEPKYFAAALPICGGGDPRRAWDIRKVPIWAHHGADDDIVPVKYSRDMVEALKKVKGNIKYTEYPGVKHNVWDFCYSNPEVFEWLFSQRKGQKVVIPEKEGEG